MVLTLHGDNHYGLQAELNRLVAEFVAEHGDLALERVDGEEASLDRISQALTSLPFLASKKMVVLQAPSKQKAFAERAEQLFANVPDSTDVILVEPKLDKRQSYYKYLRSNTDFKDFNELDEGSMARWLVDRAKAGKGLLSSSDARYLIQRVGLNQQLLSSDIDKLVLYNPQVSRATIDLLTDATPQSTIFELLEAAFSGQTKRALELFGEQRALKVEPQQIIAMLAWQLHIVALVKAAGDRSPETIAKEAKLSPYVVKKSVAIARKTKLSELKAHIADLLAIDIKSKRSALNLDDALQLYLINLSN